MAGTMAAYSDDIEQLPFDLAGVAQWTFRQLDAEQAHNVGLWCAMHGLCPEKDGLTPQACAPLSGDGTSRILLVGAQILAPAELPMQANGDQPVWQMRRFMYR